jgi:hypothetical protein
MNHVKKNLDARCSCFDSHSHCIFVSSVGGGLRNLNHIDAGSLLTLDIMLMNDFEGGEFYCALSSDNTVPMTNKPFCTTGNALLFCSHKRHTVNPVTAGCRRVCVIEFWEGEERHCGHRCEQQWGCCCFSGGNQVYAQKPADD